MIWPKSYFYNIDSRGYMIDFSFIKNLQPEDRLKAFNSICYLFLVVIVFLCIFSLFSGSPIEFFGFKIGLGEDPEIEILKQKNKDLKSRVENLNISYSQLSNECSALVQIEGHLRGAPSNFPANVYFVTKVESLVREGEFFIKVPKSGLEKGDGKLLFLYNVGNQWMIDETKLNPQNVIGNRYVTKTKVLRLPLASAKNYKPDIQARPDEF
jgi:hypothetical protein